ncbi:hypothetical protein EDB89DRAFT_2068447 [Lactarius sanguifluus]|nr:hypothetical protein EDB89DRAFT_2068447 [Lactarius sanguifluus]
MEISPLQQPLQNTDDGPPVPKTTGFRDPASAILSMYITRVQKFEDENVENWKGGAEGILVFTGLFSSTVATFISLSYPNLQQDPNVTTQALLAQISQQLSNFTTTAVWFLSLVLSLTCALMATLLQQWARRYLHIIQRKYAPLHHTRIHEFFSEGARRFGIFGFVEILPLLLLLSVFLFFAGLVVFAFRGNATVAYFTVGIVGFCTISYIALTLMPLIFHDCPYQTPLTSVLWFFSRIIRLSIFSVLYHGAKHLHERWGTVSLRVVKLFRDRQKKAKSLSETIISKLENSAGYISVDVYKKPLVRMLHWLNDDH